MATPQVPTAMTPLTPADWHRFIRNGDRLYFGAHAATPHALIARFLEVAHEFSDIEVVHTLTLGPAPWTDDRYTPFMRLNAFFLGPNTRDAVNRGDADFTPCFLSEVPKLFHDRTIGIDTAFVMVTPPDRFGYCSLGVSVDIGLAAVRSARHVVAQVNPLMPRTQGECFVHVDDIDAFIEAAEPPLEHIRDAEDSVAAAQIGRYCAELVEDGCCLQAGIGRIPDAVMRKLASKNDLGIHSEILGDGIMSLIRSGNVTNARKGVNIGKSVTSFILGSKDLYAFVDGNPHIEMRPSEYTNNPIQIAKNPNMVSINGALEVDVTGQVAADSIGRKFYSGIGGQVDFIRGAVMSPGGRPVIALESTARGGTMSRITATLTAGAGVVTGRGDVHYVVTEYGIATLRGRSMRERALELIQVAHPKFRDALLEQTRERGLVPRSVPSSPRPVPEIYAGGDHERMRVPGMSLYMRPLRPSDHRRLQEFFYSHDEDTVRQRYRQLKRVMPSDQAYRLVGVDQTQDLALAIFSRQGPRETIHAVGRFYRDGDKAEVAFVTAEIMRGRGLGAALCDKLIFVAKARGIRELEAYVRHDNPYMNRLLERKGFVRRPGAAADEFEWTLLLDSPVP